LRAAQQLTLKEFAQGSSDDTERVPLTSAIVQRIADAVIGEVGELGGDGGVIVVTPDGAPVFSMNTPGMYRARATAEGLKEVKIFADE
jgi:beta-aspartyl-peptidase (threonine type)